MVQDSSLQHDLCSKILVNNWTVRVFKMMQRQTKGRAAKLAHVHVLYPVIRWCTRPPWAIELQCSPSQRTWNSWQASKPRWGISAPPLSSSIFDVVYSPSRPTSAVPFLALSDIVSLPAGASMRSTSLHLFCNRSPVRNTLYSLIQNKQKSPSFSGQGFDAVNPQWAEAKNPVKVD